MCRQPQVCYSAYNIERLHHPAMLACTSIVAAALQVPCMDSCIITSCLSAAFHLLALCCTAVDWYYCSRYPALMVADSAVLCCRGGCCWYQYPESACQ